MRRPRRSRPTASAVEAHGTEMAGLLVGAGGPAGLAGVAPAATVLPIRVAGWQPDARGGYTVYSRTDQLLAGLERAVDPDGNGDAHDAVRIALIPLVEPFAAFSDGPLARAVLGATRLDTLVVAAAGNDGPAGPAFGSVGGPAGAPGALAVGAVDTRRTATDVRVVVRAGPERAVRPARPARRRGARPAALLPALVGRVRQAGLLRTGLSLVAGSAAVVPAGDRPGRDRPGAADAGAAAVILHGRRVAAGAIGARRADRRPGGDGAESGRARALTDPDALVAIAAPRTPADEDGRGAVLVVGVAFDGGIKPDLVAPGVGLVDVGAGDGARRRLGVRYRERVERRGGGRRRGGGAARRGAARGGCRNAPRPPRRFGRTARRNLRGRTGRGRRRRRSRCGRRARRRAVRTRLRPRGA